MEIGFHADEEWDIAEKNNARYLPIYETKKETLKTMNYNVQTLINEYSQGNQIIVDIDNVETSDSVVAMMRASEHFETL